MAKTNTAMLAAFAVLALAQLASIQLMLLTTRGTVSAAASFEPIELQITENVPVQPVSRHAVYRELEMTGNPLDWAIDGHGYYQIELLDGAVAYTRDGAFETNANGDLVTRDGFRLLPGIAVSPTYFSLAVQYNGDIMAAQSNGTSVDLGRIELARFNNPDGLKAWRSKGIYLETEESGPPHAGSPGEDGFGTIEQGFRPVETREEGRGFTVTIVPGREPIVNGLQTPDAGDVPMQTSEVYE
jgi:flagellar basal body rod protein FlgG